MRQYVVASQKRLQQARRIADEARHDETLHRLAMIAVFALEDCHEALAVAREECEAWFKPACQPAEPAAKTPG